MLLTNFDINGKFTLIMMGHRTVLRSQFSKSEAYSNSNEPICQSSKIYLFLPRDQLLPPSMSKSMGFSNP